MIGAFISDDFYFLFEEEDIKNLKKFGKIEGIFGIHAKGEDSVMRMRIIVTLHKMSRKWMRTDIDILFEEKIAHLDILKNDFKEWFLEADGWVWENGPSVRFASINVYITRGASKNSSVRKSEILNFLAQAK